jgi:hypothetical protein
MLGNHWRLRASNTQNQAITVTVKARFFKFDSNGALVWSAEQTLINAVSVSATTGTTVSSAVPNDTDKYIGAELTVGMTAASATNGTGALSITLERSTDTGTTWPSSDRGQFVGAETLTSGDGTNTRLRNYLIR